MQGAGASCRSQYPASAARFLVGRRRAGCHSKAVLKCACLQAPRCFTTAIEQRGKSSSLTSIVHNEVGKG